MLNEKYQALLDQYDVFGVEAVVHIVADVDKAPLVFYCYYSLSGRLLQGSRTGFFYSSIPPQVWPCSCSLSGCCTSGTGSSSRAFSTRGRNCSGKC